ncbi:hypothetical protein NRIC0776_11310 [Apilactobacillus kunkeei]
MISKAINPSTLIKAYSVIPKTGDNILEADATAVVSEVSLATSDILTNWRIDAEYAVFLRFTKIESIAMKIATGINNDPPWKNGSANANARKPIILKT